MRNQVYVFERYGSNSFVVADKELADAIAKGCFVDYKTLPFFASGPLFEPFDEWHETEGEEADGDAVKF